MPYFTKIAENPSQHYVGHPKSDMRQKYIRLKVLMKSKMTFLLNVAVFIMNGLPKHKCPHKETSIL